MDAFLNILITTIHSYF